jgi:serine/threonine protein kinase
MGVVWLAHDKLLREPVALKLLPPEIAHDPAALAGLRRETLQARRLSHPHILRIHDLVDRPGEAPFISMEYVDGPNLEVLRLRRPSPVLPWKFLAPLVRQLCTALDYAHGEHVIHRDLKPANLMLDSSSRLKLADFGLAQVSTESLSRRSGAQAASGTLPPATGRRRAPPSDRRLVRPRGDAL